MKCPTCNTELPEQYGQYNAPRQCSDCRKPIIDDLSEWTDGLGRYWHGACRQKAERHDQNTAPCEHEWIDARNPVVASGEYCRKCHAVRAGNTTPLEDTAR